MKIDGSDVKRVSTGTGRTTCGYFYPGGKDILFASTHKAGEACPPKPSFERGYVWPIYDGYDIYRANADGSNLRPLTTTPGYDAEATIAPDGTIAFTSVRDGDMEIYTMKADGSDVRRLTKQPGARRRAVLLVGRQADRVSRPAAAAGHGADRLPGAAQGAHLAADEARALRDGSRRQEHDAGHDAVGRRASRRRGTRTEAADLRVEREGSAAAQLRHLPDQRRRHRDWSR